MVEQNFFLISYSDYGDIHVVLYVAQSKQEATELLAKIRAFVREYALRKEARYPSIHLSDEERDRWYDEVFPVIVAKNATIGKGIAEKLGLNEYPFVSFLVDEIPFWEDDEEKFYIEAFDPEYGYYRDCE